MVIHLKSSCKLLHKRDAKFLKGRPKLRLLLSKRKQHVPRIRKKQNVPRIRKQMLK